ncbi:hypothetical protein TB2_044775 [Malus domestica]
MTAILDPSISRSSSLCMFSPLVSWLSRNALIPALRNAMSRWPVKVLRVSSPLKLRNTSYFQRFELCEEDEEAAEPAPWAELLVSIAACRSAAWLSNNQSQAFPKIPQCRWPF